MRVLCTLTTGVAIFVTVAAGCSSPTAPAPAPTDFVIDVASERFVVRLGSAVSRVNRPLRDDAPYTW